MKNNSFSNYGKHPPNVVPKNEIIFLIIWAFGYFKTFFFEGLFTKLPRKAFATSSWSSLMLSSPLKLGV